MGYKFIGYPIGNSEDDLKEVYKYYNLWYFGWSEDFLFKYTKCRFTSPNHCILYVWRKDKVSTAPWFWVTHCSWNTDQINPWVESLCFHWLDWPPHSFFPLPCLLSHKSSPMITIWFSLSLHSLCNSILLFYLLYYGNVGCLIQCAISMPFNIPIQYKTQVSHVLERE